MRTIAYQNLNIEAPFLFRNGKDGVDKGTTRKTPGTGEGARPPREDEYPDDDEEENKEVDNQEKSRNKERARQERKKKD
ncbi:hypothetical protein [Pararhodonellum marinum]|uniref:hypothetical protein n=1 Tax=Pararhodonellum marinum TaxID=2755358 RepID=UPI00188E2DDF|nr:hypothetical protein [Pararhodonellum marinum]